MARKAGAIRYGTARRPAPARPYVKVRTRGPTIFRAWETKLCARPPGPGRRQFAVRAAPVKAGSANGEKHDSVGAISSAGPVRATGRRCSVSIAPSTAIEAATLAQGARRYPFGCSRQIHQTGACRSSTSPEAFTRAERISRLGHRIASGASRDAMTGCIWLAAGDRTAQFGMWSVRRAGTLGIDSTSPDFPDARRASAASNGAGGSSACQLALDRLAQTSFVNARSGAKKRADAISPMRSTLLAAALGPPGAN